MKLAQLPELSLRARELVNTGRYGLYEAYQPLDHSWAYFLVTRSEIFVLAADGSTITHLRQDDPQVHLGEIIRPVVR